MDEEALLFLEGLDLPFSLLVVAGVVFTGFPDLFATVPEPVLVDTVACGGLFTVGGCWGWVGVLGLTCTSQGGGALL